MVVTTTKDVRWLLHKVRNRATVVTEVKHMSARWKVMRKAKVNNATVGDFMRAGGIYFHPLCDNALHAAKRMMEIAI